MTSNSCCLNSLCNNSDLYISIWNTIPRFYAKVTLQCITKKGELITKISPIFGLNKIEKISFPKDAWNIHFFIVRCTHSGSIPAFDIHLKSAKATCFKLCGTLENPSCPEIPC